MFSFYKMQVDSKYYILLDCLKNNLEYSYKLMSEFFCDEKYGIGASGVIILEKSENADFKMKMLNSEGCAIDELDVGVKCLSSYVYKHKSDCFKKINLETSCGVQQIFVEQEENDLMSLKRNDTSIKGNAVEIFEGILNI